MSVLVLTVKLYNTLRLSFRKLETTHKIAAVKKTKISLVARKNKWFCNISLLSGSCDATYVRYEKVKKYLYSKVPLTD